MCVCGVPLSVRVFPGTCMRPVSTNLQVLDERIHHIPYVPIKPEPYYEPTGRELRPRPVGDENGVIVYTYNPICAVNYVSFLVVQTKQSLRLACDFSVSMISVRLCFLLLSV